MRKVTVGAVQMRCSKEPEENICRAEELVREAAGQGAQVILLPELFERPYFCQERRGAAFFRCGKRAGRGDSRELL